MRYVFLAILLCSCAPKTPTVVDPALKSYFIQFETDVGASTADINASFGTLAYPTVGLCETDGQGDSTITIDGAYWAKSSDSQKQQLVYHELGHCALGLSHINTFKADTCPTSIMYAYTFGDSPCYSSERNYYFEQLESLNK